MAVYKRVMFVVIAVAVAIAAAVPSLRGDQTVGLLIAVIAAELVLANLSAAYLINLVRTDRSEPRGYLLVLIATTGVLIAVGGDIVAYVLYVVFTGGRFANQGGSTLIGMAIAVMLASPIVKAAVLLFVDRRKPKYGRRSTDVNIS